MKWPLIKLLPVQTKFNFVGFARFAAIISVICVSISLYMTLTPFKPPCGGLNCGVDFKGGTAIEISTAPAQLDLSKLRDELKVMSVKGAEVQGIGRQGDTRAAMIRFETPTGVDANTRVEVIKKSLKAQFPNASFSNTSVVGSKVSGELLNAGVMALLWAIFLMMAYVWFRFEWWQFGLGAVAALFHDVILTFGLFAVFRLEFDLRAVAAILTILGYSMNDTVVVFDRLRENLRKYKKLPLGDVINMSINETLSRTVITMLTALLALTGLAVLGGETLFSFSAAMIFGITIGTYSSIYVASPIILLWGINRNTADAEVVDMGGFKGKR